MAKVVNTSIEFTVRDVSKAIFDLNTVEIESRSDKKK